MGHLSKKKPKAINFPRDQGSKNLQVAFSNFLPVGFGVLSLQLDLILPENVDCPSPSHALKRTYLERECLGLFAKIPSYLYILTEHEISSEA